MVCFLLFCLAGGTSCPSSTGWPGTAPRSAAVMQLEVVGVRGRAAEHHLDARNSRSPRRSTTASSLRPKFVKSLPKMTSPMMTAARPMTIAPRPMFTSRRCPGYWASSAPDRATRPLESIRPRTTLRVRVDALRPGHVLIGAGGADGAAPLRAEEPVQQRDHGKREKKQHAEADCSGSAPAHSAARPSGRIFIHADGLIGLARP